MLLTEKDFLLLMFFISKNFFNDPAFIIIVFKTKIEEADSKRISRLCNNVRKHIQVYYNTIENLYKQDYFF